MPPPRVPLLRWFGLRIYEFYPLTNMWLLHGSEPMQQKVKALQRAIYKSFTKLTMHQVRWLCVLPRGAASSTDQSIRCIMSLVKMALWKAFAFCSMGSGPYSSHIMVNVYKSQMRSPNQRKSGTRGGGTMRPSRTS